VTTRRPAAAQTDVLNGERADSVLAPTLQGVVARARGRGAECSVRARQHGLSYRRWRLWSSLLGVLAAVGSAVAAALLLLGETGGGRAVVGGLVALVAAVCATANTAVVQTRVEEHRLARSVFLNLHTRYCLLGDLPPRDLVTARSQLEEIERSHAELEAEAPPPDARANRPPATSEVEGQAGTGPASPAAGPTDGGLASAAAGPTDGGPAAAGPTDGGPAPRLRPPAAPRVAVQPAPRPNA
jgi:hypothetical protein